MINSPLGLLAAIPLTLALASPIRAVSPEEVSPENMCGALALTCAARVAGSPIDVEQLLERLPLDGKMKSFADLINAAKHLNLATKAVRWRDGQSPEVRLPCIVRLAPKSGKVGPHFVVLIATELGAVRVIDPPQSPVWIADEELLREWDGVTLYVARDAATLRSLAPATPVVDQRAAVGLAFVGGLTFIGLLLKRRFARSKNDGNAPELMRRTTALAMVGWIAIAAGLYWSANGRSIQARQSTLAVDLPSQLIEVGEDVLRSSNGVAKGEFILTNRGTRPARIVGITPDCSCVQVTASSHSISPGGSVRIQAGINLEGDISRRGKMVVELEDAIPQRLTLRLEARRIADQ